MASGVSSRFAGWAAERGLELELRTFPSGTRTAEDAARAIGCDVAEIVKSLIFTADGAPFLALVSGINRIDERKLGQVAGGRVEKAEPGLVRSVTGYSIGGVPPFGHASRLAVYCDRDLLSHEVVWAAAGRPDSVFSITPERLVELSGAAIVDLCGR